MRCKISNVRELFGNLSSANSGHLVLKSRFVVNDIKSMLTVVKFICLESAYLFPVWEFVIFI